MNDTTHTDTLAAAVTDWNLKDIVDLREALRELYDHCEEHGLVADDYVDMCNLPSADIPADVDTGYPVWSMDLNGDMLVGESADDVMSLSEYRELREYHDAKKRA